MTKRSAIVTGSTSGIGLAVARRLASNGADVMLNGLGDAAAAEVERARIAAEFGVTCLYSPANMMDPEAIEVLVGQAQAAFGGVDILVNNAGIQHVSPVEDFPVDKWNAILAINLTAAFHTTRAVVPGMKTRGWGRIVNIASAHALVASPFKSAYVAAKHGLAGFSKSVALEVATFGVTVNAVAPGYVWTPLVEKQIPDTMAARGLTREQVIQDVLLDSQPTKTFVTVEQVAGLVAYLASDEAASITGTIQSIDGGWTAH